MSLDISATSPRVQYTVGSSSTTTFAYGFPIFQEADLKVYVDSTLKTLTTHYSVTGEGTTSGGNVVFGSGLTNCTVTIFRDVTIARTTDFPTSGAFQVDSLNTELDTITAVQQELDDDITRSLRLDDEDGSVAMTLPLKADRVGKILGFNSSTGVPESFVYLTNENTVALDGLTAGTVTASKYVLVDSNKDIGTFRNITLSGELDAGSLDISGNADIDGTLEANAITVNGVTLAETISDTVGAMVGSNTETGITVTYEDSDNTLDFALGASQTTITSLLATDIKIGEDDETKIDFETADTINFYAGNEKQLILTDGALTPASDAIVDLGSSSLQFKDAYIHGTLEADAITIGGTTLAETISDTVGGMVGSNTETGIAVTYDDSDNTLDFVIGAGSIVNSMLADDAVGADELASNAVVTASIVADAVTGAKIADDQINSEHYIDGSIDTAHIADGAITADKIADGTVVAAEIASNAVTTAKINADAVTGAKIADNAINSEHYTDGSIDTAHIANDQITNALMADDAIDSAQIADGAVDTAHIADLQVTTAKIANDAVTGAKIPDNAINSEHYTDGSIDTAHIADDQITQAKMANDSIGADELASSAVVTASIVDDNVTQAKIADDAVGADQLASSAVVTASIVDNAVTLAKMAGITRGSLITGDSSGNPSALAIGTNGQFLKSDGNDLVFGSATISGLAVDDLTVGDDAVSIATSSGNITIDAQGNDTDIIFKGTDNTADITMLTLDGSDAGTASFNHDVKLADNGKIILGTGDDAEILFDGTDTVIKHGAGSGKLEFQTRRLDVKNTANNETMIKALEDGAVTIYYDNSAKFKTTSSGIEITGGATFTGDIDVDGTANLDVVDIDGALTQDGGAVFNEDSADVDFRVESNGNANMLFVDGGNDRVGIGGTPSVNLHIIDASDEGTPTFAGATHFAVQATASSGDNVNASLISGTAGTSRIMFGDKDDEDIGKIEYNNSDNDLAFFTNTTERMRIDNVGRVNLGIGELDHRLTTQQTTGVGTSASVIATVGTFSTFGGHYFITGRNQDSSASRFCDQLTCGLNGSVNVLHSTTVRGSPHSRSYGLSSESLTCAMGGANYTINVFVIDHITS